jgi:3-isopropylmalate/(R)-2-methylmalate dehydratase small subunit
MIEGKVLVLGHNVDTDQIIGAAHLTLATVAEMVPHMYENEPRVVEHFRAGDILVAGSNFGCGSSREQAPAVLKQAGVAAILASSFARIFFRNAINLGLPVFECEGVGEIRDLDRIAIDPAAGKVHNLSRQGSYSISALPAFLLDILRAGGVVRYLAADGVSPRPNVTRNMYGVPG